MPGLYAGLVITAGQRGDSPQFEVVLSRNRVPRLGPGRPPRIAGSVSVAVVRAPAMRR
ncbi:hypothetical protein J2S55_008249 [Streptosporangium brasiliense]|uniref:Uncharacterized protein n=1 Tax=Streptosporangium brasiliense TaxID=47480 RepID=A0ABT9RI73_9ACTN|nr:hypothetical protein [Streptosporangium brasiliense]